MTQEILDPKVTTRPTDENSKKVHVGSNALHSPQTSGGGLGWKSLPNIQKMLLGGMVAAFVVLTWPIWRWLWAEWMANEYYSHGILILPAALFLIWRRFSVDVTIRPLWFQQDLRSLALMTISIGLYVYWLNEKAYFLAAFAMIGLMASLIWTAVGWRTFRALLFPLVYLVLMVPLPIIERSTYPLAMFTGVCSGALVNFLGLPIRIVGNAVEMPGTDLLIGAQCSGVNSMITLVALTSLCAYIFDGPWWGRVGLVLLSIPLAMIGNILRVGNLLYVAYYWGVDAAFTFYHDYSGFVFFAIVLVLLLPLMRALQLKNVRLDVI